MSDKRSPRPPSRIRGCDGTPQEGGGEGRGGKGRKGKGGKGKGALRPPKPKNETPPMTLNISQTATDTAIVTIEGE